LPLKPVMRIAKSVAADGSIEVQAIIKQSGLNKVGASPKAVAPHTHNIPKVRVDHKGWPPAAIADWGIWGHKNPPKFFAKWPELSSGGGMEMGGPQL